MATNNAVNNTLGNATATQITWTDTTKGIVGTTTNDSAAAGYVGELKSANASGVSLSTGTSANTATLTLGAGDWDVWGGMTITPAATTTLGFVTGSISTTSATLGNDANTATMYFNNVALGTGNSVRASVTGLPLQLSGSTTIYLVVNVTFGTSTCNGAGYLYARRRR